MNVAFFQCPDARVAWDGLFKVTSEGPLPATRPCPCCKKTARIVNAPSVAAYKSHYSEGLGVHLSSSKQERAVIARVREESDNKTNLVEVDPGYRQPRQKSGVEKVQAAMKKIKEANRREITVRGLLRK